ncbi:MAG: hypothetical protein KAS11_01250 [Candidatus Aenigmarchaeota archaeon]|nr:hypothetical protein [Candidatus Aenigmarchaeota archaeon]
MHTAKSTAKTEFHEGYVEMYLKGCQGFEDHLYNQGYIMNVPLREIKKNSIIQFNNSERITEQNNLNDRYQLILISLQTLKKMTDKLQQEKKDKTITLYQVDIDSIEIDQEKEQLSFTGYFIYSKIKG